MVPYRSASDRLAHVAEMLGHDGRLTRRNLLGATAAGVAGTMLLSACGSDDGDGGGSAATGASTSPQSGETEQVTVMLDFTPNPLCAWLWVGMNEGYYADAGIEITTRVPPATLSAIVQLVGTGKVQFGLSEVPTIMYGRNEGIPVISVAQVCGQRSDGVMSLPDSGISTPADLAGKRMAQFDAPSFKAFLETAMASVDMSTDDVDVVNAGFNTAPLVAQEKVAAADALYNSERVTLMDLLGGEEPSFLYYADYGVPAQPVTSMITNQEWAAENRDLTERFIAASMQSIKRYLTDEDARVKALTDCCTTGPNASGPIELQVQKFDAGKQFWPSPGMTIEDMDWGYQDMDRLSTVLDWAVEYGLADKAGPVEEYFTNDYLTEAARNPTV